jgi:hypothetical protein
MICELVICELVIFSPNSQFTNSQFTTINNSQPKQNDKDIIS